MANDRMYLKCVGCGERIMLAKTFGGADGYALHKTEEEIDRFFTDHALCNMENSDECKHQDFALEYESQN